MASRLGHEANAEELLGDNLPRLQELNELDDPKNMFQKWHNTIHSFEHTLMCW